MFVRDNEVYVANVFLEQFEQEGVVYTSASTEDFHGSFNVKLWPDQLFDMVDDKATEKVVVATQDVL